MRDQVPDRPVFTRAKNKFPSWDFNNFAVTMQTDSTLLSLGLYLIKYA